MRKLMQKILKFEEKEGIISISLHMDASDIVELNVVAPSLNSIYFRERHSMSNENNGQASPQEVKQKGERNGKIMCSINSLANFLIQLFLKCEKKYSCSRTKLEKLLTIANLVLMKSGKRLFNEAIIVKPCGTGIPTLSNDFMGDIVIGTDSETSKPILDVYIKEVDCQIELETQYAKLLEQVFSSFGAYQATEIGKMLDMFKNDISELDQYDNWVLSIKKTEDFFGEDNTKTENEIISFVTKYEL